jgi:hypothetical protein
MIGGVRFGYLSRTPFNSGLGAGRVLCPFSRHGTATGEAQRAWSASLRLIVFALGAAHISFRYLLSAIGLSSARTRRVKARENAANLAPPRMPPFRTGFCLTQIRPKALGIHTLSLGRSLPQSTLNYSNRTPTR